jgi:hypothetical protein
LGVLLFTFKFLKNLSGIIFKIKRNPKFKNQSFVNVLLQDLVIPHTFLSYIFLNKHKFETHQIPKEVLLHEETHAKQKHSLDVLFIELLHILFWFNPFIYFIKRSIKLNHEFLADQAVINNGITPSTYQQILLAFSSNASEPQLANAINYSSIKKRFTVMKTHTTKKALWLRSFILLPLLGILIYSFSEKKVVEKRQVFKIVNGEIKVHITKEKKVIIDNETIDFNLLSDILIEFTKNEKIKPLIYIDVEGHLSMEYLDEIKNEMATTNLQISTIRVNSMFLDETNYKKETKAYFKGIPFTGDTMAIKNEKNELIFGISSPNMLSTEEIDIIKKGFSEKYNIKHNKDTEHYSVWGKKDSLNPNPFSLSMTGENNTSSQNIKSKEEYDIITLKVPRNKNHSMSSNDLKSLSDYANEIYSTENRTGKE